MKIRHVTALCISFLCFFFAIMCIISLIQTYNNFQDAYISTPDAKNPSKEASVWGLAFQIIVAWPTAIINSAIAMILPLFVIRKYDTGITILSISLSALSLFSIIFLIVFRGFLSSILMLLQL